jgi:hypothetical protein
MKQDVNRDASGEAFEGGKEGRRKGGGGGTFSRSRTLDKEDKKALKMLRNCLDREDMPGGKLVGRRRGK